MAIKRTKGTAQTIDVHDMAPSSEPEPPRSIEIPLLADGKPDFDSLSGETLDQLAEAMGDRPVEPAAVPPESIALLIRLAVSIQAAILAPRFHVARPVATVILTPDEGVAAALSETGARVLTRYAGPLSQYADEFALVSTLIAWQLAGLAGLRVEAAAERVAEATAERVAANAPASTQ